jgi:hypothetical protein
MLALGLQELSSSAMESSFLLPAACFKGRRA